MKKLLYASFLYIISIPSLVAAPPRVVASIKPIHSLVAQVGSGVFTPDLLLDKSSPHGHVLRPSEILSLHEADLVVWVGPDLESFLKKILDHKQNSFPLHRLSKIDKLPLCHTCSHHDEHRHENHLSHAVDPHLWLSPTNAIVIAEGIAAKLIAIDPENAPLYKSNLSKTINRLQTLTEKLHKTFKQTPVPAYIVFHDAYQYFTKEFNLPSALVMTTNPEIPLSAHKIKSLKQDIAAKKAHCVFKEPQFSDQTVSTLTHGTSLYVGNLDPIGYTITAGEKAYETLITELAQTFVNCATRNCDQ